MTGTNTTGVFPDEFLPCRLIGNDSGCPAEQVGQCYYLCSACNKVVAPIRSLEDVRKAPLLPEKIRRLLAAVMMTDDASSPPFSITQFGGSHYDRLDGLGKSGLDHPDEICLSQLFGEKARIAMRWGELCKVDGRALEVENEPPHKLVAQAPLFIRLRTAFEELGLEFRAPCNIRQHLFTGRFKFPESGDAEIGVTVLLDLCGDELMSEFAAAKRERLSKR